jgi:hypothetical protein
MPPPVKPPSPLVPRAPLTTVQPQDPFVTAVYAREGYVSSVLPPGQGPHFQVVRLDGLPAGAQELHGAFAQVSGQTPLGGNFRHLFFQRASTIATDGYAQVHLYHTLDQLWRHIHGLGFDMAKLIGSRHRNQPHPIVAKANAMDALNAFFSRQDEALFFGRGMGKFALAASGDVVVHEAGHAILYHMIPALGLTRGDEGGAIHEGFGDALATLYFNDPELAEGFMLAVGKVPDPFAGLRDVENTLTLREAGDEVHKRGRVYGGFFWSLRSLLAGPEGPLKDDVAAAAQVAMQVALMHGFFYRTTRPRSSDFITAVLDGIEALEKQGMIPVPQQALRTLVVEEGVRRQLISAAQAKAWMEDTHHPQMEPRESAHMRYDPTYTVYYPGGRVEYYQQQLHTREFGYVDLRGGSMIRRYSDTDARIDSSLMGAWPAEMANGLIGAEALTLMPFDAALGRALDVARAREIEAQVSLSHMEFDDPVALSPRQMAVIRAQRSRAALESEYTALQRGENQPPWLVVPWESAQLHYEIRCGFERCYIDAGTGLPVFQADLFV